MLKYGRWDHGAIFDGEKFLIIGGIKDGAGAVKNEVSTLEGSIMTCVEQSTALEYYTLYPELFLVADDFDKDLNKCLNFVVSALLSANHKSNKLNFLNKLIFETFEILWI